jgi:hypothetical protein
MFANLKGYSSSYRFRRGFYNEILHSHYFVSPVELRPIHYCGNSGTLTTHPVLETAYV